MTVLQQLVNGLSLGGIYALIAIGFSLVYGVLGLVNFAHGDIYMAGTFVGFFLYAELGLPLLLAVPLAIASGALLSMLVERVASRPVRGAPRLVPMMTTFGVALILRNLVELEAGSATQPFNTPLSGRALEFAGVRFPAASLVTLAVSLVTILAFTAYLRRSRSGFAIRASAQDLRTSGLMGVPIDRTVVVMFALGGALGVVGGLLYASAYGIFYIGMGFQGLLKGFAAAVVGGIGSLQGALLGGLLLGVTESMVGPYLSGAYRDAIAFLLLITILLIRPVGLIGAQVQERV